MSIYRHGLGEGSTLEPSRGTQPTNLMRVPTDYLSVRVTIPHDQWEFVVAALTPYDGYIAYPHAGAKTHKEHFHIFIPFKGALKEIEALRKRIYTKTHLPRGNTSVSIKFCHNGILNAITYGSKEHTLPIIHPEDGEIADLVEMAPPWVERVQQVLPLEADPTGKKPKVDADWQLTYTNFIPVAIDHYRKHPEIAGYGLRRTCEHLCEHTRWKFSKYVRCGGVPPSYEEEFLHRVGQHRQPPSFESWWTPRCI